MPYTGIQKRYKGNEVLNHALSLVRPSPSIPWPKGRVYHTRGSHSHKDCRTIRDRDQDF